MIKRYLRLLLCVMCSFFITVSAFALHSPIHGAESLFLDTTTMKIEFDFHGNHSDHEGFITLGGQVAFCADYYKKVGFKKTYYSVENGHLRYDDATLKKLRTLAYYGYGYNGDQSYEMYMATQAAIWEVIHGGEVVLSLYKGTGKFKNKNVDINAQQASEKLARLRTIVAAKWTNFGQIPQLPSSNRLSGIGDHHVLTLHDPLGTLEDYDLTDDAGLQVSKNGNTLAIKASQAFTGKKTLRFSFHNRNNGALNNSQPILYMAKDYQDVVRLGFMYNNSFTLDVEMRQGQIEVIKKDAVTNEPIIHPATFKLFDEYGQLVATLTTKDGKALSPLLPEGTYTLEETQAPNGYVKRDKIQIQANFSQKATQSVNVYNDAIKGAIHIDKNILLHKDADLSLVDHDFSKIAFTLRAQEDILAPDHAKVIYKKGTEIGTYHLSKEGKLDIDQLYLGKYVLQEVKSPSQLITNNQEYIFDLKAQSEIATVVKKATVNNQPTIVEISKKVLTGEDELPGVKLALYDQHNNLVDQWISTSQPHVIEGLHRNTAYKLVEVSAPKGYVISSPITFTIQDHAQRQKIVMKDKQVVVSKQAISGEKELPGAKLAVLDDKGKVVDQWTSTNTPHYVSGLIEGKTYILRELEAPKGYVISGDVNFTVSQDKTMQKVVMKDKQIVVSKQAISGEKELPGAKLAVLDDKGKVVDQWTSTNTPHYVSGLIEGKTYILRELEAPKGYVISGDVNFTVSQDKTMQKVVMKDKQVVVSKQAITGEKELPGAKLGVYDEEGNEIDVWISTQEPHYVNHLTEGKRYILKELEAPAGYVLGDPISFQVEETKTLQQVVMKNKQFFISKKDIVHEKELPGAKLVVVNEKDEVVDEWLSTDQPHAIRNLKMNQRYILRELLSPDHYAIAKDIPFTVSDKWENQYLTMYDRLTELKVSKTDASMKDLKGAKLQIVDEDGHVVEEWISNGEVHIVKGLILNKKYILREVQAPDEYKISQDLPFTMVDGDHLTIVNEKEPVVPTSDATQISVYALLLGIGLFGILLIFISKKVKGRE